MSVQDRATGLFVLMLVLVGWLWPRIFASGFAAFENFGVRLATRKRLAILVVALAPVLVRVSLLPILSVPLPYTQDEFSYLLAADTFAHGRLANPPHPMWVYLDTFHVNQHPTYSSIYPPAQGAALAVGELLGNSWTGVLLTTALMCGAGLWAMQGWLPAPWALLGAMLLALRLGIFGYWANSYWGGQVAAFGGALVIGALPRILHFHRARDAIMLGLGMAILANSRPFEGLIFCVPVLVALVVWLCGRRSPRWRETLSRVTLPVCAVMLLCLSFMGYYNWRLTGNPIRFAYVVNVRSHFAVPQLAWEKTVAPFHFLNPQFESYYNVWWPSHAWAYGRPNTIEHISLALARDAQTFSGYFLWPELCIAVIALPWLIRDRRVRFLILQLALCIAGFVAVAMFLPHYAAPLTATTFILVAQAFRHIRLWRFGPRPVGIGVTRMTGLAALLLIPLHPWPAVQQQSARNRAEFARMLEAKPGKQLVIVRYSPLHYIHAEWVYNKADIDNAKIVWAREIPGISMQPLLDYFHERKVWLVEPDLAPRERIGTNNAPE